MPDGQVGGTSSVQHGSQPASSRSSEWKWTAAYCSGAARKSVVSSSQRRPVTATAGAFTRRASRRSQLPAGERFLELAVVAAAAGGVGREMDRTGGRVARAVDAEHLVADRQRQPLLTEHRRQADPPLARQPPALYLQGAGSRGHPAVGADQHRQTAPLQQHLLHAGVRACRPRPHPERAGRLAPPRSPRGNRTGSPGRRPDSCRPRRWARASPETRARPGSGRRAAAARAARRTSARWSRPSAARAGRPARSSGRCSRSARGRPRPGCGSPQQWCFGDGGTSSAGFRSKNPTGFRWNPVRSTGITGQSSVRGMWLVPNTYQSTTSVSRSWPRSAAVQRRQAGAAGVLERVVARRIALVGVERRHPQVLVHERRPAADRPSPATPAGTSCGPARACSRPASPTRLRRPGLTTFQ